LRAAPVIGCAVFAWIAQNSLISWLPRALLNEGRVTFLRQIDHSTPAAGPVLGVSGPAAAKHVAPANGQELDPLPSGSSDRKLAPSYKLQGAKTSGAGQIGARVDRHIYTPVEVENREKLSNSSGFKKLTPDAQKQMLDVLKADPRDSAFADDLRHVAGSESYRNLSPAMKQEVLNALAHEAGAPGAKNTCADLVGKPGFGALKENEQKALLRLTSGTATGYSEPARAEVEALFAKPEFVNGDADKQASMLRDVLKKQNFLPNATTAPDGTFSAPGKRVPYTVTGPKDPNAKVKQFTIRIDNRDIPVVVHPAPAGKVQHTPEDMAKAIAAAPKENRDQIKSVLIEPAERKGAYMAAGGDGIVRAYPVDSLPSEDFTASAVIHETGHIVSSKQWGDDKMNAKWKTWRDAMAADVVSPSKYGHGAPGDKETAGKGWTVHDDFAEAMLLYQRVKGTAQEPEMRRLFPERFKVLDEMTKAK
jgi:hypothetical protein